MIRKGLLVTVILFFALLIAKQWVVDFNLTPAIKTAGLLFSAVFVAGVIKELP